MVSTWDVLRVYAFLLCGSKAHQGSSRGGSLSARGIPDSKASVGLDYRSHVSLVRTENGSPDGSKRVADPREPPVVNKASEQSKAQENANNTAHRYHRGAWGTLECGNHTVPVSDEKGCMAAAEALGGDYNAVGAWHHAPEGCVIQRPDMKVMFMTANKTSSVLTDFPNFAKVCDTGGPTTCPPGYNKELGDAEPKWGDSSLSSGEGGIVSETIDDCKAKCNNETRCLSFKWSPTFTWGEDSHLVCILNTRHHPSVDRLWLDFVWCAKTQATIDTLASDIDSHDQAFIPRHYEALLASDAGNAHDEAQVPQGPVLEDLDMNDVGTAIP